jgi:hypothetical protein
MYREGPDIELQLAGETRLVGSRPEPTASPRSWLVTGAHILVIMADREKPPVVLPLELAARIAAVAENARPQ